MARCVFHKGDQSLFLQQVIDKLQTNCKEIGALLNLSSRTIRDWKREKYFASHEEILKLSKISGITIPPLVEIRKDWWSCQKYASKGGLQRHKLYGLLGTVEDRRKGGYNSWINRCNDHDNYKFINRFNYPSLTNSKFAEFVGIVLGDGGFTSKHLSITLNRVADKDYIPYVQSLILSLFNYQPKLLERKTSCATDLTINGVDFIKFIQQCGLKIGNKVKLQIGVPAWIQEDLNLSKECVKGLMDTDGCIFNNHYQVNGKWYQYQKIAFSNRSQPLLNFVYDTLNKLGFHPIYYQGIQVRLCYHKEIQKYLKEVGSSNTRLLRFCY